MNRAQRIYTGVAFKLVSIGAFYASYFNFYGKQSCSYGGSKLSWLFGIACESIGQAGVSIVWLVGGVFAFTLGALLMFKS
jgi:hypothetical protein